MLSGKASNWSTPWGPKSHYDQTLFNHGDRFALGWENALTPASDGYDNLRLCFVDATIVEKGRLPTQYEDVDIQFGMVSALSDRAARTLYSGSSPHEKPAEALDRSPLRRRHVASRNRILWPGAGERSDCEF